MYCAVGIIHVLRFSLRGDKKSVDACEKFLKTEIKRIIDSSFVLEVPLFTQFIKFIIGKSGATLNQIKEETDTRINIPKDSTETAIIKITGLNPLRCVARIAHSCVFDAKVLKRTPRLRVTRS